MINDFPLTDIERREKRNETTSEIAAMMLRKNELEEILWEGPIKCEGQRGMDKHRPSPFHNRRACILSSIIIMRSLSPRLLPSLSVAFYHSTSFTLFVHVCGLIGSFYVVPLCWL